MTTIAVLLVWLLIDLRLVSNHNKLVRVLDSIASPSAGADAAGTR